jgi:hypothetical protein
LCRYDAWTVANMPGNSGGSGLQTLITEFSTMTSFYHPSHHRQKELSDAIVSQLVLAGSLPLSTVEQEWFIEFKKIVDPKYKMPSRYKVNSITSQKYKKKRAILDSKLGDAKHITIILDLWSYHRMRSYMGITVHFMTVDRQFKSYLLNFSYFVGSHTSDKLLEHTINVIEKFHLKNKRFYVITDNAANMLNAFKDISGMVGLAESVPESDAEIDNEVDGDGVQSESDASSVK